MEKLKHIKEDLVDLIHEQLEEHKETHYKHLCTQELGEVIDMVKDISETMYYCSVVKAMEEGSGTVSYTQKDEKGSTKLNINGVAHPAQS